MGKVFTHMTMSLDGYIAGPDDQIDELFEWFGAGDVAVASANENIAFDVDEASANVLKGLTGNVAAILARTEPPGTTSRITRTASPPDHTRPSGETACIDARRSSTGTERRSSLPRSPWIDANASRPRESHLLIASADQRQKPQSSSYRTVTRGRSATPEPQSPSEPPVPSVRAKLSIAASSCMAASEEALPLSTSSAI